MTIILRIFYENRGTRISLYKKIAAGIVVIVYSAIRARVFERRIFEESVNFACLSKTVFCFASLQSCLKNL
jgi:hypothetical protein